MNNQSSLRNLFWSQASVSFGGEILEVALPLLAAVALKASPLEMGALATAMMLPWLLVSLFAGVWIDRGSPKRIMVLANYGRGLLLLLIPLLLFLGWLSVPWLLLIAFAFGVLRVFFELALPAFTPALAEKEQLLKINSQISTSQTAAEMAGPSLAGLLTQWVGAGPTVWFGSVFYWVSAFAISRIPADDGRRAQGRRQIWLEIGQGLRVVIGHPVLRALVFSSATYNLYMGLLMGVQILFLTRELGIGVAWVGFIFAAQSAGGLVGASLAGQVNQRLGMARTAFVSMAVSAVLALIPPLLPASPLLAAVLSGLTLFFIALMMLIRNVSTLTLRQTITPKQLLGRVGATNRFIGFGVGSLGGIMGGALAEAFGLRAAMFVGAGLALCSLLWLVFSPLRDPGLELRPIDPETP